MGKRIEYGVRPEFTGTGITTDSPAGSLDGGLLKCKARREGAERALRAIIAASKAHPTRPA